MYVSDIQQLFVEKIDGWEMEATFSFICRTFPGTIGGHRSGMI